MKQKIVIQILQLNDGKKRSKAMQIASVANGVSSVAIEGGADGDKMVVIGDGVDAVDLAKSLKKKKVGYANLVSVEEVKAEADKGSESKETISPIEWQYLTYYQPYYPPYYQNYYV